MFNAFIKSHVLLAATVWGNGSTVEVTNMDAALTHVACVIYRDPKAELTNETFKSLGIRFFRDLMFYFTVTKIFDILDSNTTDYYHCSLLIKHSLQRCTCSTEGHKFIAFKQNRTVNEIGFHFKAIRDGNTLPSSTSSIMILLI